MTPQEREERIRKLKQFVEERVPSFASACKSDVDVLLLDQDAFAADYQEDEFILLGKATKYAGLFGKELNIIAGNKNTNPSAQTEPAGSRVAPWDRHRPPGETPR
jgi:hypothetical protein